MTIEEMTTMSYILLAIAVVLGIVAVVLFFSLKIPKAYRAVKGQKKSRRRRVGRKQMRHQPPKERNSEKSNAETVKLEEETVALCEDEVHFTMLQDITYVHAEEEL